MPDQPSDFKLLMDNMGVANEFQQYRQDQAQMPPIKIKAESNEKGGMDYTFKMDQGVAQGIMQKMTYLEQALSAMTQEANRMQAQEQRTRQHPLIAALSTVAGELAQDKRLPPAVSALGRASLALNPLPDELAARRMDLEGKIGTLGTAGLRTEFAQMGIQQKMDIERLKLEQKRTSDAMREVRLTAKAAGGALDPVQFAGIMNAHGVTDPEQISSAYAGHKGEADLFKAGKEAEVERKAKLMTFGEQLGERLAQFKGRISLNNRIAGIREAFINSVSQTKADFELKLHEAKKAIDEAAASSKEFKVLGPQVGMQLKQANQTNGYLDTVEHMLEQPEFAQVQGPLFQWNPKTGEVKFNEQAALPKQFKNIDRTLVESQISHEIPRLLGLLLNGQAGGASILRTDVGKKLVQDMGITGAIRTDQALGILKIIRDTNNNNVVAAMRLKPQAPFAKIKSLLSADDPRNEYFFKGKRDSFGGTIQPFPSPDQGGGGETPTESEDPIEKALREHYAKSK